MRKKLLVHFDVRQALSARARMFVVTVLLLLSHGFCVAQLQLLKDINTAEDLYFNEYRYLTKVGSNFYFVSRNDLWFSNGTKEGTVLLRSFKNISNVTLIGTTLYFAGEVGTSGLELWRSNGTTAGTIMIRDIYAGSGSSSPNSFTDVNGTIFFSARNANNGVELWKTNGTAGTTVLVKDIITGTGSSNPGQMVARNGILLFVANDAKIGYELWRSDGTAAGTVVVKDIRTSYRASSLARYLTNINGTVFFSAIDDAAGRELWKTDGTTAGTVRVKDIRPGTTGSDVENLVNLNGTLIFTADDGVHGDELWKSNGTAAGTVLVQDMNPGAVGSNNTYPGVSDPPPMGNFTIINGLLYFTAADDFANFIYRTDGTTAGTIRITDVGWSDCCGGSLWPRPEFTYLNGFVYFFNYEWNESLYAYRTYLYKMPYNGTTPVAVREMQGYLIGDMIAAGSYLFASARLDPDKGFQLVRSDGTVLGTIVLMDNARNTNGSDIEEMITHNGLTYFRGRVGSPWTSAEEVWRTDGTTTGTIRLGTAVRGYPWVAAGSYVYWTTFSGNAWQVWRSAGTPSTTILLWQSGPDYTGLPPKQMVNVSGRLYMSTQDGQLWRSDGTVAGTRMLKGFPGIRNLYAGSGRAFLVVESGTQIYDLWRADATGAYKVITMATGLANPIASHYPSVNIGSVLYFVGFNNTQGHEVWRTDGTAAGTYMVQDLSTYDTQNTWDPEHGIQGLVVHNNILYVSGWDSDRRWWIWKQTGARTFTRLKEIHGAVTMKSFNGLLYIWAYDRLNADGNALYVTNGTAEGFRYLGTFDGDYDYTDLGIVGNVIYFTGRGGRSLWRTDGTACGTFAVPTPGMTHPGPSEGLGTSLVVAGYTATIGDEPYIYRNINSQNPSPCGTSIAAQRTKDDDRITAYPNPYTQEFSILVNGRDEDIVDIAVYTSSGFPVETMRGVKANISYDNLGATWPPGMYILKVHQGSGVTTHLVVKK